MIIIGEKINSTRKPIKEAIAKKDTGFLQELARTQVQVGADCIDVNTGAFPEGEAELMDAFKAADAYWERISSVRIASRPFGKVAPLVDPVPTHNCNVVRDQLSLVSGQYLSVIILSSVKKSITALP